MRNWILYILVALFTISSWAGNLDDNKKKDEKKKETPVKTLLKEARASIKNKKDQAQHEKKLGEALNRDGVKNSEKAEILHTQALLNENLNEAENLKAYLKQKYDTAAYFNTLLKATNYAVRSDSFDILPDAKGKVKPEFRKQNREMVLRYRQNIYNGGRFYLRKNDYKNALPFFTTFINLRNTPLTADQKAVLNDTLYSQASLYAMISAYNQQLPKTALLYINEAMMEADSTNSVLLQEYKVRCYHAVGDTITWVEEMKNGITKYPKHDYFFTSLMDYYENEKLYDNGLALCDSLLTNVQDDALYYYAKSLMYHHKAEWNKCIEMSDSTLVRDSVNTNALYNKGISYVNLAMEAEEAANIDTARGKNRKAKNQIRELYLHALPPFERLRVLTPDNKERWARALYRIYLNLNMGKEFEEIEKLMKTK